MKRDLRHDSRAAAAVEFALIAPLLIATIFGMIEGARFVWTRQAVQQAAFVGVRCLSLSVDCPTTSAAVTKAVDEARRIGIPVQSSYVVAEASATCGSGSNTQSNMKRVTITMPFRSAAFGFLPYKFTRISVAACFPPRPTG